MASSLQETLARLSSKPGVQATLVLSRKDGAVIRSSGFSSTEPVERTDSSETATSSVERGQGWSANGNGSENPTDSMHGTVRQFSSAEATARAVFTYVSDTGRFMSSMGDPDDVQLLRLRSKRQEIVIVPDQKYLMVVFQDISKSG